LLKKKILAILFVSLFAVISGCGKVDQAENVVNLRVAFFPNLTHAQALLGQESGEFEEALGEKVRLSWHEFNSGTTEIEAFFAGELDMGYIGPGPAINGYIKSNGDLVIVAGVAKGGSLLVARQGLDIDSVDFSGLKVGVPNFGNTQDIQLRGFLKAQGIKDSTQGGSLDILQVKNSDVRGLFDSGDLDMACVPEPWGSILLTECGAQILRDERELWRNGDYPVSLIICRREFLETYPAVVEEFLRTHAAITQRIISDPMDAQNYVNAVIAKLTGKALPEEALAQAMGRIEFTTDPGVEAVREFAEIMSEVEMLSGNNDVAGIFDLEIINAIHMAQGEGEIGR
jgi:NitT/TauT family transport system substrate-binding protein